MVKQEKLNAVENLKQKFEKYPVIGIVDLFKLPTKQLQSIQKTLRGKADFIVVKKSILMHALEGVKRENIKELEKSIPTQPALVFTEMDPFKFYIQTDKMRAPDFAKEGDVAEEEVFIPAGPTSLMAGPVISEFAKAKIPAGVEEGKIAVKRDTVAAKKGDVISKDLAPILRKLKIQPVTIGINVVSVYDKGTIYRKEVLSLAGEGYVKMLAQAHTFALNLSVAAGYPTKDNVKYLLAKAHLHGEAINSLIKPAAGATETPKSEEVKTEGSQVGGAT